MTGRSVPEWMGSSPDAKIPAAVRARVFEAFGGVCQLTKRKIRAGEAWEIDHRIPLALGGAHRESNLWPVLADAHKAKTREDVGMKAKADRCRLKHIGQFPQSKHKIKSRGFPKGRNRLFAERAD